MKRVHWLLSVRGWQWIACFQARRDGLLIQGRWYSFLGQAVGPRVIGPRLVLLTVAALSGFGFVPSARGAAITVASPVSGTTVPSPVWIRGHNTGCNGLTPTAFGYSLDTSSTLIPGVTKNDIDTTAAMSAGKHTIYYKSWVSSGVCPVVSTTFTVAGGSAPSTGTSPSLRFIGFLGCRGHRHHQPGEWRRRSFVLGVGAGAQFRVRR